MQQNADEVLYEKGITCFPARKNKPRWLTREEAVCLLFAWKDQNIPKYNLDFGPRMKMVITSGLENVYLTGLIDELIERIRNGYMDPISEVAEYWYEMDEILATSDDDHFITHRFAGFMANSAYEVLNYLKKKEKELIDYERQRILRKPLAEH